MICQKLWLVVATIFLITQSIDGRFSGHGLCSAKFDSEYEDACLRGYSMEQEVEKHGVESTNGVTCENSCSDVYKDEKRLVKACKYGCGIKVLMPVRSDMGSLWDRLNTMMMDQLKSFKALNGLISSQPKVTSDSTEHGKQEKSEDKHGASIRRIKIFLPLDHPELATVQRSSQTLDDGGNLFDRIKQLLQFPPLFGIHADHQTVERNDQQMLHHDKQPMFRMRKFPMLKYPEHHEEKHVLSITDRVLFFVRRVNPIVVFLSLALFFMFTLFGLNLVLYYCRRRTRHTYLYTPLPTDVEEISRYYHTDLNGKKKGEEKADNVKNANGTLDV